MGNQPTVPLYPLDLTGESPQNKVVEILTLSPLASDEYNYLVPSKAPFYNRSLVVEKINQGGTKTKLEYGRDYLIGGSFPQITRYTKNNHAASGTIVFTDLKVAGNYQITYQTLGDDYVLGEQSLIETLKNKINNPILITWEEILDKPLTYPPEPHGHHANRLDDYDDFINALEQLINKVEQAMAEDRRDSPSYIQLVTEILALTNRLRALDAKLEAMKHQLEGSTAGQISDAVRRIQDLSNNLDLRIRELREQIAQDLSGEIQRLTAKDASIDNSLEELENRIMAKFQQEQENYTNMIRQGDQVNAQSIVEGLEELRQLLLRQRRELLEADKVIEQNTSSKLSQQESRLNNRIGQKVDKAGDTMTGALTTPTLKTSLIELKEPTGGPANNPPAIKANRQMNFYLANEKSASLTASKLWLSGHMTIASGHVFAWGDETWGSTLPMVLRLEEKTDTNVLHIISKGNIGESGNALIKVDDVIYGNNLRVSGLVKRNGDVMEGPLLLKPAQAKSTNKDRPGFYFDTHHGRGNRGIYVPGGGINGEQHRSWSLYTKDPQQGKLWFTTGASNTQWEEELEILTSTHWNLLPKQSDINGILARIQSPTDKNDVRQCLDKIPYTHPDGNIYLGAKAVIQRHQSQGASGSSVIGLSYTHDLQKSHGLNIEGHCRATAYYIGSDRRLKDNLIAIKAPMKLLEKIQGYHYQLKSNRKAQVGVLADDVEKVLPELVYVDKDDPQQMKAVQYEGLVPVLIEAVKELSEQVAELKQQIKELKGEGK